MPSEKMMSYLKSVKLSYEGEFSLKEEAQQKAVLKKILNGNFTSESPRGHYHTMLNYNHEGTFPMEVSAAKTSRGFKVKIRITAENSEQVADVDSHIRKKIEQAGGVFKNKTLSASIL
jgi:hypothetical protein